MSESVLMRFNGSSGSKRHLRHGLPVLTTICFVASTVLLCACGGGTESTEDDAHAAASRLLGSSAGAAQAGGADEGDHDGIDLARALLGGITAAVTGTGMDECVKLAVAARGSTAPEGKAADPDSARIPIVKGLKIVYAGSNDERDFEYYVEITDTDEQGLNLELRSDRKTLKRRVLWEDVDRARCFAGNYSGEPRLAGPGLTWLMLSRALLTELRDRGGVEFGMANEPAPDRSNFGTFVGKLSRVNTATYMLTLDDSLIHVPTLMLRADLRHGELAMQLELEVLDDPEFPLQLRVCCVRSADRVVRIERRRERPIERALAETGQAIVYGIQFDFGSADLREDSEPVIGEITDALRAYPDWHLRIEGHTDAIGDAASNLDLSGRRAAAVKAELVRRLGAAAGDRLDITGNGESRPRADNETLEGRAANRRVELIRTKP